MFARQAMVHDNAVPEPLIVDGISLRQDVMARDCRGEPSNRIRKRTSRLINKLHEPLLKFLEPGEHLLYLARVQRHVPGLIQFTMGWYVYYASAAVIAITDRRLLHFRVRNNNRWDSGVRTCSWSDVDSAEVKGWLSRVLRLKFRNGSKYRYWRIARADALIIKKLLPLLLKAHEGTEPSKAASFAETSPLVSLCPECKHGLEGGSERCPACGRTFRVKKRMYWLSLIPSAAYIYTRNFFLAFIDLIAQSYGYFLLALAAYTMIAAALGWKNADGTAVETGDAVLVLAVGLVIFGFDVLVTIHHNKYFIDDLIPSGRPPEAAKAGAAAGTIR